MVARSPEMVRTVKEAIVIGCGSMGERHTRNLIKQGIKVRAFADPFLAGKETASLYSDAQKCIQENSEGRLVVIASPTYLHSQQAIEAIISGARALFIEKPVAVNNVDTHHLLDLAYTHKVKVVVGYNFRYHFGIHNLIESVIHPHFWLTAIGIDDVTKWPSFKKWGADSYLNTETGGLLWTSGSHAVDIAISLHGEVGAVLVGGQQQENTLIQRLHHIGGGVSVLYNKWEENHETASTLTYLSPDDAIVVDLLAKQPQDMHEQLMFHALEYFNKGILDPSLPTLNDAIHGVDVLLASEESIQTGGPVTL